MGLPDVLVFEPVPGARVTLLPLALGTVVEETQGAHRFQAIQTSPESLAVRIEHDPQPPHPDERSGKFRQVWVAPGAGPGRG